MPDSEFIHIATAAASLCDKLAAKNGQRIYELERELLTNPHKPDRVEAEREYLALTEPKAEGK